ncbi:MAG: Cof-type HAD-IIB family hydrolase [Christensenella sp.]|uniref:Cof-type HAD-IIB family hydrolase n=1 Tax=Christensenella sp. TaxID=1935934 RepID=UPI002B1F11FC|nr:Cof-type HAD-IIB family hydrolase [Christensenella sp.]MEA5002326.1 Cof-type HAD-IIB family hydrolase [Christensenella sp.]
MQKIKLLAMDIDGTLVKDAYSDTSDVDADAVRRAQEAGVKVTLATGRLFNLTRRWLDMFDITEPVISINGADIRSFEKTYYMDDIPVENVKEVFECFRDTPLSRYISADNLIYHTKGDSFPTLKERWDFGYMGDCPAYIGENDKEVFDALQGKQIQKVLIWAREDKDIATLHEMAEQFRDKFSVVRGDHANLEFNSCSTSKGSGLKKLADFYGFDLSETMAIGDSGNDVDIIRTAGVGVAMGNSMKEAMDVADYVTADVLSGGVAQAIDKFVFGA